MPKLLTKLRIDEISAVDRGAGEGVRIMLLKRKAAVKPKDVSKAKGGYMSNLTKFFENLFGSNQPPTNEALAKATARLAASVKSIVADDEVKDKGAMLAKSFVQFQEHLDDEVSKALPVRKAADKSQPKGDDIMSPIVLKALGLKEDASEQDILKAIAARDLEMEIVKAGMSDDEDKFHGDEKDDAKKKAFRAMTHEQRKEAMGKAAPTLPAEIVKQLKDAEDMKKRLDALESERALVGFTKQAVELGLPDVEGVTLQKAYNGDKDAITKIAGFVKTGFSAARSAGVFKEFGGTGSGAATTPYDELMAKAEELRKKQPELRQDQAFAKVYADPANREIVKRERAENRPSVG